MTDPSLEGAYLILRFDAPLMSFGAPIVDNHGVVQDFPGLSLVTGLLGNALGYDHRQHAELNRLQARLRYATRRDVPGEPLRDYQTVDLGQPHLDAKHVGWTTRGYVEERAGASGKGTHIRYRDYRADSVHTVALTLLPSDERPTLDDLGEALTRPARPLFLGRKCCLPASRIVVGRIEASSPVAAVIAAPLTDRALATSKAPDEADEVRVWWADDDPTAPIKPSRRLAVTDERDWLNQHHGGRRILHEGTWRVADSEAHHDQ